MTKSKSFMALSHKHRASDKKEIRVLEDSGDGHVVVILHDGTSFNVQGTAENIMPHLHGERA